MKFRSRITVVYFWMSCRSSTEAFCGDPWMRQPLEEGRVTISPRAGIDDISIAFSLIGGGGIRPDGHAGRVAESRRARIRIIGANFAVRCWTRIDLHTRKCLR